MVRVARDPVSGRWHFGRRGIDWRNPLALPVTITSWRTFIAWTIFGCFAPWILILVILLAMRHLAFLALLVPVIMLPIRLARVGMVVTERDVTIIGYLHNRKVPRRQILLFASTTVRKNARLSINATGIDRPILLPTGEDLLIPVGALAKALNELYELPSSSTSIDGEGVT